MRQQLPVCSSFFKLVSSFEPQSTGYHGSDYFLNSHKEQSMTSAPTSVIPALRRPRQED
jgi:hypothetical protein